MSDPNDDEGEVRAISGNLLQHLQRLRARGTLRVPAPVPQAVPAAEPTASPALALVREELGDCKRCKLSATRKNIVFGNGDPGSPLVFVGEAPGANEDEQGIPFCGDAGNLLNKMIEAMGWKREEVYVANLLKCRPPGNRNPEPDEIGECEPFLIKQLGAIRPRMIVALGKFAAQFLLGKPDAPISAIRGRFFTYQGVRVMPTYHPAYLLRSPGQKRVVWEDLQAVIAELARVGIDPPHPPARK